MPGVRGWGEDNGAQTGAGRRVRSRSDPGGGVGASLVDPLKESGLFGLDVQQELLAIPLRSETLRNLVSGARTVFKTALHIMPTAADPRTPDGG